MPKTVDTDQAEAYRMTAEEVVGGLGSDPRHGLSGQDAVRAWSGTVRTSSRPRSPYPPGGVSWRSSKTS